MPSTRDHQPDAVAGPQHASTSGLNLGRRRRPDRGLPSDEALRALACTYLQNQRTLWPGRARDGSLPPPDADVIAGMAERFRRRFLDGEVPPREPQDAEAPADELAASYLRYSCDNSNPRSLDQQLRLQLERAGRDGRYIPWACVFADAAVTGTTADRRGYELAKEALGRDDLGALYIDEIGRASRDAIEALRLGRLVDRRGKRLIGVSDNFDSASPTAKLMLSVFATLQEWFIDQLRSKVNRGMQDAFSRGTNLNPPAVGYRLEPAADPRGHPLFGRDGERLKMKVVDEGESAEVLRAFQHYALEGKSPGRIAVGFNERRVGGLQSWDHSTIRQLLRRSTYAGIEIYRRTFQERDPETGQVTVRRRPRKDWRVRRMRHLRIVPWNLWKATQRRLDACKAAYAKGRDRGTPSRTELYPKVLIRPVCGSCGAELRLGRSGRYASFCCPNGLHGKRGCTSKGYKSMRIVDEAILGHLRRAIFTPEFLGRVLEAANGFLAEEARRPREDVGPLEAEARAIQARRDRLVKGLDDDGGADLEVVFEQVRRHERRLKDLRSRLDEMRARNDPAPPPMTPADAGAMLADLRGLLEQDVAIAAPILRELTGPVVVEQVWEPGGSRPAWFAGFTVDAVPVLAKLAASRRCPTTGAWEFLKTRGWTMPEIVEVWIEPVRKHQAIAHRVAGLAAGGASVETIARAVGVTWGTAHAARDHGDGDADAPAITPRAMPPRGKPPTYQRVAAEVARLRDRELMPFAKIAARLGITAATATRAYDSVHKSELAEAAARGRPPGRGRYSHLGGAARRAILRGLRAGQAPAAVAAEVGCSVSTARRAKESLPAEG